MSAKTLRLAGAAVVVTVLGAVALAASGGAGAKSATTRVYYIAADEVAWDYAPTGTNQISGAPFDETANVFVAQGPRRIGSTYWKALYREYTDGDFDQLKPESPEWAHLGTLGPVLRGEVGDTIEVVFRNNTELTISMHPHGVFYDKASEGAPYADGTSGDDTADDAVTPGGTWTYEWTIPERAGPGPDDPSTVLWMYHSHTDEVKDTNAGLIGPIIVGSEGSLRADGTPKRVDREIVTLFTVFDENESWYLERNIDDFAGNPVLVDPADEGFVESNLMHGINGFVYGNLPVPEMQVGDLVRWYVLGMGTEVDLHTPHWHGQTGLAGGMRTDVVELMPGSMKVFDMEPDNPGRWLFHCHVNDHITAGMLALFDVDP